MFTGASEPAATNQGQAGYLTRGSPAAVIAGRLEMQARSIIILTFGGGTNEVQRTLVGERVPEFGDDRRISRAGLATHSCHQRHTGAVIAATLPSGAQDPAVAPSASNTS